MGNCSLGSRIEKKSSYKWVKKTGTLFNINESGKDGIEYNYHWPINRVRNLKITGTVSANLTSFNQCAGGITIKYEDGSSEGNYEIKGSSISNKDVGITCSNNKIVNEFNITVWGADGTCKATNVKCTEWEELVKDE